MATARYVLPVPAGRCRTPVVALDGFEVAALVDGFRSENLLAEIALPAAVDQAPKRDFGILRDHAEIDCSDRRS